MKWVLAWFTCFAVCCVVLIVSPYQMGFKYGKHCTTLEIYREAYASGLMEREITKDDQIVYRWKELEKLDFNYEK